MLTKSTLSTKAEMSRSIGTTNEGRAITWFVDKQIANGIWREERIPAEVVGLSRPVTVCRASRKTNLITHSWFVALNSTHHPAAGPPRALLAPGP